MDLKTLIKSERPNRAMLTERTNMALKLYFGREQLDSLIPMYATDEDPDKYQWRKRATIRNFRNFTREINRKYLSAITRSGKIVRETGTAIDKDENDCYPSLFWKDIAPYLLLLDELFVGVVYQEAKGEITTEQQRIELQGNPLVRVIFPQYVRNFEVDDEGKLLWVTIDRTENKKQLIDYYDAKQFGTFTKLGETKTPLADHGFTEVPILRFAYTENDAVSGSPTIGHSFMSDINTCALGLLECVSMLYEAVYLHLNIKLVVNEKTNERLQQSGYGNATPIVEVPDMRAGDQGMSGQTRFLQTPTTEIQVLRDLVYLQKKDELYEIAQLRSPSKVNVQSGVAKMIDLIPEDETKAEISGYLSKCDKLIVSLRASPLAGYKADKVMVTYPTIVDGRTVADATSETEAVSGAMKTGGLPRSKTGDQMLSKRLYHKALPDSDERTLKIIDAEIESAIGAPIDNTQLLTTPQEQRASLAAIPAA